ncbi:MAG: SDR family NAD(P)-dependent oxidoreductase [Paracoccaceae bacterium]
MATALVTGATSGIGRAVALALAGAGYRTHALGRNLAALEDLRAVPNIVPLACDLTDREAVAALVEGLEIDVLVNNAGIVPPVVPFAEMAEGDLDAVIEVNLSAVLHLTRAVVPGMIARGRGDVIFTGSTAGHAAAAKYAVYGASKAAVSSFAAALRAELSPAGVRVTEVVAGRVETGLYRGVFDAEQRAAMYAGAQAVQPEDVAAMVMAAVSLPQGASVARFDIVPTRPTTPAGARA